MRICFMSREYPPETGWGGIGTYTYQMAHALSRLGHEIHVVCLTKEDVRGNNPPAQMDKDVHVHRVVWGNQLRPAVLLNLTQPNTHHVLRAALPMWRKFLELTRTYDFDVVEAPDHLAEGIFIAATRLKPLVVRLHTPYSRFVAEGYHNIKKDFDSMTVSTIERWAMSEADILSSPSINLAEFVAGETGVALDKIQIVRNPVDTIKFSPEGPVAKVAREPQHKIVYFAGRLEARKGIHHLIEAVPEVVKAVPEARFVIVGADTKTEEKHRSVLTGLKEFLDKKGVSDKVNFVSYVPLNQMPEYYRVADICVVPSLFDNAPYTVLEALASGKPVIGSTAGGTPEYIKDKVNGLHVPSADPKSLGSALIDLLQDNERRAKFGEAARHAALHEYSFEVIAAEAIKTYEMAIARHKQRHDDPLYKKAPEQLADELINFVKGYQSLLHQFGESLSLRYRTSGGLKLLFTRPKLTAAKAMLASGKLARRMTGQERRPMTGAMLQLERSISEKSQEDWS